jgi:hypothetical protein
MTLGELTVVAKPTHFSRVVMVCPSPLAHTVNLTVGEIRRRCSSAPVSFDTFIMTVDS